MKRIHVILLAILFQPLHLIKASEVFINTEDHPEGIFNRAEYVTDIPITRQEKRSLVREEKHYVQLETKFKKMFSSKRSKYHGIGSIHDPVDKWFWIWTIGWGLGILITIISGATIASGFIGILWFSLFIIGSVALVIWLIKKFGKN
jgi:hypothetical protein